MVLKEDSTMNTGTKNL